MIAVSVRASLVCTNTIFDRMNRIHRIKTDRVEILFILSIVSKSSRLIRRALMPHALVPGRPRSRTHCGTIPKTFSIPLIHSAVASTSANWHALSNSRRSTNSLTV
ncbi:hypothetical protein GobsT_72580 [Gemmata obscuriglobus]|nr:hypothetical protein GobsT_72580 [Gemmata obscuriglobus]VTS11759.1 unnamed protein product [Gemmata obscuriglobus UQM 2246]